MDMSKPYDGGPAFPNITPDMCIQGGPGMSLRDWLAGQALVGIAASGSEHPYEVDAINAYRWADAMLDAREAPSALTGGES